MHELTVWTVLATLASDFNAPHSLSLTHCFATEPLKLGLLSLCMRTVCAHQFLFIYFIRQRTKFWHLALTRSHFAVVHKKEVCRDRKTRWSQRKLEDRRRVRSFATTTTATTIIIELVDTWYSQIHTHTHIRVHFHHTHTPANTWRCSNRTNYSKK